jgi:hypothetical protein
MPKEDWNRNHTILLSMGLRVDRETCALTPHEIDTLTAALTACLYLRDQTGSLGDEEEGRIGVAKKQNWSTIKIWVRQKNCIER